jgi:peptidoglycan/xylan/chitin deacetylase (PgdA/CDA1 family)
MTAGKYIENYAEIKPNFQQSARSILRSFLLDLRYWKLNRELTEETRKKPRIQFLYLHHTFKDELTGLCQLIENLMEHNFVISYSEAIEKIVSKNIDKPYIVFSTDDGFKNNFDAAEIFRQYGISACFFINPGIIGMREYEDLKRYCKNVLELPPIEFLNWDEINKMQQQGHEIGGHTWLHQRVAGRSQPALLEDMQLTFEAIEKNCGKPKHFAFPYGRFADFTETGRHAMITAGFSTLASAERGCHTPNDVIEDLTKLCVRRDHILLNWKYSHIDYFLMNNLLKQNADSYQFAP